MATPLSSTPISLSSTPVVFPISEGQSTPEAGATPPPAPPAPKPTGKTAGGQSVRHINPRTMEATRARYANSSEDIMTRMNAIINTLNNARVRNDLQGVAGETDSLFQSLLAELRQAHEQMNQLQQRNDTLERTILVQAEEVEADAETRSGFEASRAEARRIGVHQYRRVHPDWVPGRDAHADWESTGREGPEPVIPTQGFVARIRELWEAFKEFLRDIAPYALPTLQFLVSAANLGVGIARLCAL